MKYDTEIASGGVICIQDFVRGGSGRAIAQPVSRRLPTAAARVQKPGSGHVGFL
jgi:hypothetical protein